MTDNDFLPLKGNFRNLIAFQKTECIYDITYHFAHKYLQKGDRTVDQMVQAARSGRQNIAEGCAAATTSKETEIKLLNVAKASLQELLLDYEDYLRTRNLKLWDVDDDKSKQCRRVCSQHNESSYYRQAIELRTDEAICNIAITLIHQTDVFLLRLIERAKQDFLQNGGIKEQMFKARTQARINQTNHPNKSN